MADQSVEDHALLAFLPPDDRPPQRSFVVRVVQAHRDDRSPLIALMAGLEQSGLVLRDVKPLHAELL